MEHDGHAAAGKRLVVMMPVVITCLIVALERPLKPKVFCFYFTKRNALVSLFASPDLAGDYFPVPPTIRAAASQDPESS